MVLTKELLSFAAALALWVMATLILSISTFAQQNTDTAAEIVGLAAYRDRVNVLDADAGARVVAVSATGRGRQTDFSMVFWKTGGRPPKILIWPRRR